RSAPARFAPPRLVMDMSASISTALLRSASLRSLRLRSADWRLAPLRSLPSNSSLDLAHLVPATPGRGESLHDAAAGSAAKAMIANTANIIRFITPPDLFGESIS